MVKLGYSEDEMTKKGCHGVRRTPDSLGEALEPYGVAWATCISVVPPDSFRERTWFETLPMTPFFGSHQQTTFTQKT